MGLSSDCEERIRNVCLLERPCQQLDVFSTCPGHFAEVIGLSEEAGGGSEKESGRDTDMRDTESQQLMTMAGQEGTHFHSRGQTYLRAVGKSRNRVLTTEPNRRRKGSAG